MTHWCLGKCCLSEEIIISSTFLSVSVTRSEVDFLASAALSSFCNASRAIYNLNIIDFQLSWQTKFPQILTFPACLATSKATSKHLSRFGSAMSKTVRTNDLKQQLGLVLFTSQAWHVMYRSRSIHGQSPPPPISAHLPHLHRATSLATENQDGLRPD